jgi:hypothetical protein
MKLDCPLRPLIRLARGPIRLRDELGDPRRPKALRKGLKSVFLRAGPDIRLEDSKGYADKKRVSKMDLGNKSCPGPPGGSSFTARSLARAS